MPDTLKEQLVRSIFRFRKIGLTYHLGYDVNMSEIAVMTGIARNTEGEGARFCASDIQNNLYITKPAVSQLYGSLEKKGYILREIDTSDRRKILVTLTPKGAEVLKALKEDTSLLLEGVIARLGEGDTRQMIELFNRFADISEDIKGEKTIADKKREDSI
jgi:DNA-binding MarR family transcriptional regulator